MILRTVEYDGAYLKIARVCWCALLLCAPAARGQSIGGEDEKSTPRYNRDVRPILAENCFRCHGPDAAARQGDLRLDDPAAVSAPRDGSRVIDRDDPGASGLLRRLLADDVDERMPPPDSGSMLTDDERETLRRWVLSGAAYERHWSFQSPERPPLPTTPQDDWSLNAIDRFVLAQLAAHQLTPQREATSSTLIRRVSLALTGLPPSLDEIDAFEQAYRFQPGRAYARLVDRLLESPRYGEHMARAWLDAARYADTNGYFTDEERTMWPWRDWVIAAFNANQPFDQFTIEQLAGDLLPDPTVDQRIATGFNRNHTVNNETGIVEEEFRVEYVVDRVDTTATVWMGLTLGCAQCHDHKYDPVPQRDFYRFYAFFNNGPERGLSGSGGNSAPVLQVPSPFRREELAALSHEIAAAEKRSDAVNRQLDEAQRAWESSALASLDVASPAGLVVHEPFDVAIAPAATVGSVTGARGLMGDAAKFAGDGCVTIPDRADFDSDQPFSFGAWVQVSGAGCVISKMDDANDMRGFDITIRKGKAIVNLVHLWNRDAIRVTTKSPIPSGQWVHLFVTYDGSQAAAGVRIYLDGQPLAVSIDLDQLTGSIRNGQPLRVGRRQASNSYKGLIDEVRVFDRQLGDDEVHRLFSSELIRGILSRPAAERAKSLQTKLRAWFVEHVADQELATVEGELRELRAHRDRLAKGIPTTMVMQDKSEVRRTFVLARGQYDQPQDEVAAGLPKFLSDVNASTPTPANRLALARWLVQPQHPLTARVTVNRLWQQLFGTGIVKTVDDFGTQGEWPSHPRLLDWLAVELIESGWDVKHIMRLIVTSATFRQSSQVTPELLERDRENRLLARGPRFRLSAEAVRDSALAASGLLVEQLGGPSVKPYQPAGLWEDVSYDGDKAHAADRGDSLYRRSLYTYWKRQAPPPNMLVFDAPTRETCTVSRSRTNTPLQALVLMNDPTFVEAARKLAERVMLTAAEPESRIELAFRIVTARRPTADEARTLTRVFRRQLAEFQSTDGAAVALLSVGESPRDERVDQNELAAYSVVANLILCLDEVVTSP